ncbi:hypothetical protein MRY87_03470 [bacterium]|nr:hypothetical protein [bacterium]
MPLSPLRSLLWSWPLFLILPPFAQAQFHPIELISTPNSGGEASGPSVDPRIVLSDTGRYVLFESTAEDLVTGDDNGASDIFLADREADEGEQITRISVNQNGGDPDGASQNGSLSGDGRYVVFQSAATDLVLNDNNEKIDIFLYDRDEETTTRISVTDGGDGGNGDSTDPVIARDGSAVVFQSTATDLVANDDNEASDIFLYTLADESLVRISVDSDGLEGDGDSFSPSISGDGTAVVFQSGAGNLVADDTDEFSDIFLHDVDAGTTSILSLDRNGTSADGASSAPFISDDGTLVAFVSSATDLVLDDTNEQPDIFLRDISAESTIRVSGETDGGGNGASSSPVISGDNTYVLFESLATDIVLNDDNSAQDIFSYNRTTEEIVRLSVDENGSELTQSSFAPSVNTNGQFVVFSSADGELTLGDDNELFDIFFLNTQCLLAPDGVTPGDEDSDGTDDCDDECPTDAAKTDPLVCGCGEVEDDSDGDGTPDCTDSCPEDDEKTIAGACGCGVSDADDNGNGIADCNDFSSDTTPRRPVVIRMNNGDRIRVIIPKDIRGFRYEVQLRKGGRTIRSKETARARVKFRTRRIRGRITVRYRVLLDSGTSNWSKRRRIRL